MRMESGEFNCNAPAYGFKIVDGQSVVKEDEAKVIRRIFDLYLQGIGQQNIADILKVPKPSRTDIPVSMLCRNCWPTVSAVPLTNNVPGRSSGKETSLVVHKPSRLQQEISLPLAYYGRKRAISGHAGGDYADRKTEC